MTLVVRIEMGVHRRKRTNERRCQNRTKNLADDISQSKKPFMYSHLFRSKLINTKNREYSFGTRGAIFLLVVTPLSKLLKLSLVFHRSAISRLFFEIQISESFFARISFADFDFIKIVIGALKKIQIEIFRIFFHNYWEKIGF